MSYALLKDKRILLVDDDPSMVHFLALNLREKGCNVTDVGNVQSALGEIDGSENPFDLAIIDMYIPETESQDPDRVMRGEQLAYTIRGLSAKTKIIGMSWFLKRQPFTPINDIFSGFINKDELPFGRPPILLFETIEGILISPAVTLPKVFIVHGQDDEALLELKNYLQNNLKWDEPIVLRERPSGGKTIIDKFEQEARDLDLVFVLMTPDDEIVSNSPVSKRRSRQNVIFELGFFYAKMQRESGKILLLRKGNTDLPSDIAGIIYIDISYGIRAAGEDIRRELTALGWLP